jgi:membrane protein implicated in regulation of membrane protease activity
MEPDVTLSAAEALAGTWDADREAARAAGFVAAFVGVPALLAAGTVLFAFALTLVVLLAPLTAAVLTCVVWRYARPERRPPRRLRAGAPPA